MTKLVQKYLQASLVISPHIAEQLPIQPRGRESDSIAYSPTDSSVICLETCYCLSATVCPLYQSNDSEKFQCLL